MTSDIAGPQHHFAGAGSSEIAIDPSANPWLLDHTVQGVAVVPGAVYMEALAAEYLSEPTFALADVEFHALLPLTSRAAIFSSVKSGSSLQLHHQGRESDQAPVATASISDDLSIPNPIAATATQELSKLSGADIYDRLAAAGNDYGPQFKRLTGVRRSSSGAWGEWSLDGSSQAEFKIHPLLLDLAVHALGLSAADRNNTYLLRRIGRLVVAGQPKSTTGGVVTAITSSEGETLTGSAWILDDDGTVVAYLDAIELGLAANQGSASEHIVVGGTFTLDPIADSVRFWSQTLDLSVAATIAPYGQIFQQLLDPGSTMSTNPGTSAAVIRLEDWTRERTEAPNQTSETVDEQFDSYTLPDGRQIASLNEYETRYLEREIFIDEAYARHGVSFEDGDVIVDIGANIGMFSLFAAARASNLRIFAYEPSPVVFPILATNLSVHCPGAIPIQAGAGSEAGEADLTFYPRSSVFSGFDANAENDGAALGAIIRNTVIEHLGGTEADVDAVVEDFMSDRLQAETHTCRIESVSELIEAYDLDRIDLLKVDAEKSERAILDGIRDSDWPKIRQMVVEVHDQDGQGIEDVCDLLKAKGFELAIEEEKLLEDSGLYNIFCSRPELAITSAPSLVSEQDRVRVQSLADELVVAVETFLARGSNLTTVFVPPTDSPDAPWFKQLEDDTVAKMRALSGSHVVSSAELLERYQVTDVHDPIGDRLGHVPYRPDLFAALGTSLVRYQQSVRTKPYKVLVLDCDNTLWSGVAGELGPLGVEISQENAQLQQRAKQLASSGTIIALASKNDLDTVKAVFNQNQDMILEWDDIVTHRVNWDSKAANLADMAAELDLGLDSFIFIDDNPVEIAEVRAALPQVLSLQVPTEHVGRWLNNIWAFDQTAVTKEDTERTQMYRDAAARKRELASAPSLESFINDLNLVVEIQPAQQQDIDRLSQLTQRTNQFNFNPNQRTVAELNALAETHELEIVTVSDRFGGYGTVAALIYTIAGDVLTIDTFLISCRVLGRGVEHHILAHAGRVASGLGISAVRLEFVATDRNSPAQRFVESTGASRTVEGDRTFFEFDSAELSGLSYQPESISAASDEVARRLTTTGVAVDSAVIQRVSTELTDMSEVAALSRKRPSLPRPELDQAFVSPQGEIEEQLAELWQRILGLDSVGVMDSFFDLGGSSLLAVDMIAQLENQLGYNLSVVDMYDSPTVSAITKILTGETSTAERVEKSHDRGSSRRKARAESASRRRRR